MGMELISILMVKNTLEILKILNLMVKEKCFGQIIVITKVFI